MPRIDPVQLLKCLSVLLSPDGGIRSINEVKRLVGLMNKFSKKLVSKCIYIQILKRTQAELLGLFMGEGGWALTHLWLTESIRSENWALIREILELLLLCPVDVERLKTNNCPKLVKELSKVASQPDVQHLSSKVVEQWLKLVKGEPTVPARTETNMHLSDSESIEFVDCTPSGEGVARIETCGVDSDENGSTDEEQINSDTVDCVKTGEGEGTCSETEENDNGLIPVLKISVKDGKQVVSKVEDKSDKKNSNSDNKHSNSDNKLLELEEKSNVSSKENERSKKKDSDKHKSSSSSSTSRSRSSKSSSSSRHSSKSSSSDKHRSQRSSTGSSSGSSKNSRSKSREGSSSTSSKDSDKYKKYSDSKSKSDKEKGKEKESIDKSKQQAEKNIETLNKLQTPSVMKLGKIPKKVHSSTAEKTEERKEKPSISIEVRNPNDPNRPKTVKMFNSKFRSHGLDEEAKPPLIRGSAKKPTTPPAVIPPSLKRPSPIRSTDSPPEKRPRVIEHVEKPGAIKLIPPKPKPAFLLESDLFMDALTASATNKKEPRKRKRRFSGSKETPHNESSPPVTPTAETAPITEQPAAEKKPTPLRFYQDTLDTEEDDRAVKSLVVEADTSSDTVNIEPVTTEIVKIEVVKTEIAKLETVKTESKTEIKTDSVEMQSPLLSPTIYKNTEDYKKPILETKKEEIKAETTPEPKILKGVLCVHKKSGPKKSLRWRDSDLEEIQYFELDETERVNVTKTFLDMKQMERVHERESFQKARNLPNDDVMEEKMSWRGLLPMDVIPIDHGKHSKEKDIQMAREKMVLQCLYFNKLSIPDSASEPDIESHPTTDPVIIPLEDVTGNPDSVNDFQNTPWPEPKSGSVQMNSGMPVPPLFQPLPPFGPGFNNPPFGMPGFQPGPVVMPNDWHMNGQNMMMPDNMNMNMNMNHEIFMGPGPVPGPNPMFPGAMGGDFQMMDTMNGPIYPPGFPGQMGHPAQGPNRPMGPPGTGGPTGPMYGLHANRGSNIRGPGPRANNPHWRNKGPNNNNWNGPPRGGNSNRGNSRVCCYFQRSGYCRLGDKCQYLHVGANNGPF